MLKTLREAKNRTRSETVAQLLIEHGLDVNAWDNNQGESPLIFALHGVIDLFAGYRAGVDKSDNEGPGSRHAYGTVRGRRLSV